MLKVAHCFLTLMECTFFIFTEYQAAILHLKREHKEEIETLKVYFCNDFFLSLTLVHFTDLSSANIYFPSNVKNLIVSF